MNLTPRLKKILIIMLEEPKAVSIKELAGRIGVSKRTVQRELEFIETDLEAYPVSFESKTGKGVWLSGTEEDKKQLLSEIRGGDIYDVSNREERRKRLILEILKGKGLKKLFYYASQFQVSEATVSADLEAVEGWLNDYHLTIIRKPGSGIEINGTEENYRKAIRAFIDENMNTQFLKDAYEEVGEAGSERFYETGISQILKEDVLKRVLNTISSIQDKRILSLTESSYTGLVLHISIAVSRMIKNEILEQKKIFPEPPEGDEDFALAEEIAQKLEQEFEIEVSEVELSYICLHLKGAKHQAVEWSGEKNLEIGSLALGREDLFKLINEMIDAYGGENRFLFKQDAEFIQGLLAHLQPTFIRLLYDMKISNPVLGEIKEAYPDIFERSRKAAAVMERWIGKAVPEEEAGFLTIHFGAAQMRMEGISEDIRCVRVGVICASGIGISRLMLSRLDKIFKSRIRMEAYGQNDITPYIVGKTDFFVSSIAIKDLEAEVLQVNPLLTAADVEWIGRRIYHYERLPVKERESNRYAAQLEQINILAMQIKTVLRYFEVFKLPGDLTFPELVKSISQKMSPYADRQFLIQNAIEKREQLGTQVFAELGFALLHTMTQGVVRPCFHVCLSEGLDAFTDPYLKGIHIVLVMLLPEDDNVTINRGILGYISSTLIEDYEFLQTIGRGEREEIEAYLSSCLRKFFNQHLV